MGDGIFLLRRKLRRGPSVFRKIQDRIIAEAVLPLRFRRDQSLEDPLGMQHPAVRKGGADIAGKVCRTLLSLRIAELLDDACILHRIGCVLAEIARTVHTRQSQHVIDAQAGIIGHDDVPVLQHIVGPHVAANADGL